MMTQYLNKITPYIILLVAVSCVPLSKFDEMKRNSESCTQENAKLKSEMEKLSVSNTELSSQNSRLSSDRNQLIKDTLALHDKIAELEKQYIKLERENQDLQVAHENQTKGNVRETTKLMSQLQATQDDLQKKEEQLKKLEYSLGEKKRNLDALTLELEKRNVRMKELESVLNRKDSAVNALKSKVSTALLGFEKDGLSVNIRNGKVYVSLEEKLLFQSGKYEVNKSGANALKKLAKVLEQNTDINVLIEGHTDDVPYRSEGALTDNWDLSVKRATAVVRIILQGSSVDPKRLTVAGRSQYLPLDNSKTAQARQKNRRTEIILTPKLDELFKILENN
jgi:chemotaxis protein MotB